MKKKNVNKMGNIQEHTSHKLQGQFPLNLVCRIAHLECIEYVNLIGIVPVVIEICEIENRKLTVPVNNTYALYGFISHWHTIMYLDKGTACSSYLE